MKGKNFAAFSVIAWVWTLSISSSNRRVKENYNRRRKISSMVSNNLPSELTDAAYAAYHRKENPTFSLQSVEETTNTVAEAKMSPPISRSIDGFGSGDEEDEKKEADVEGEVEEEEDEYDYDKQVKDAQESGEVQLH